MKKIEIISNIMAYNPEFIWELDKSEYYCLIGHYEPGIDSYWLEENLEDTNVVTLKNLLRDLKRELSSCLAA